MNAVKVNQRPCLGASRLWLKIVVQTHAVVESVKLVLQKSFRVEAPSHIGSRVQLSSNLDFKISALVKRVGQNL